MNAFIEFNKGIMKMSLPWRLWLMLLVTVNLVVPLFFLDRREAQFILGAMLVSMTLMIILTSKFGFTHILGLGHILWLPLVVFLLLRLSHIPAADFFGLWIRVVLILNTASLVLDTVDVTRYICGDKQQNVKGL
jgi:hypothetical protein